MSSDMALKNTPIKLDVTNPNVFYLRFDLTHLWH